jgi:hypothetical protein
VARAVLSMPRMTNPSRRTVGLVLAAGALASVATSYVIEEWNFARSVPVETALDATRPLSQHAISAELTGAFPIRGLYGYLEVEVEVTAALTGTATSATTLILRQGEVELDRETVGLAPAARTTVTLSANAFTAGCEVAPCVDGWELDIERLPVVDSPGVTISGDATLTINGTDDDEDMLPPPGTELFVTITELGPPP